MFRSRFGVGTLALAICAVGGANGEEVEHPIYKSWAAHPVGTVITLRSVTESGGSTVESSSRQKLIQVTPQKAVIEVRRSSNATGQTEVDEPVLVEHKRMFPLLPGVKREDVGKPSSAIATGKEQVTLAGRTFDAYWYDSRGSTEAGPSSTRTWLSEEVPGKLLRSVTSVPAGQKTTTVELVEIREP